MVWTPPSLPQRQGGVEDRPQFLRTTGQPLKQSEEIIDAADTRFRFTPSERRFLLGALKGEGLLFARGGRWPIKIEASPAEHRLATTNPRELLEHSESGPQQMSIDASRRTTSAAGVARP